MTTETFSEIGVYRPSIPMDPHAKLDYTFDWTVWLAGIADTIASMVITPTGVTIDDSSQAGALVTVWCSAPVAPVASVHCKIVTAGGRTDARTIYLIVKER